MAIREQTQINSPLAQPVRPDAPAVPVSPAEAGQPPTMSPATSEWTARPLRLVASWALVAQADGAARLEMAWRIPDPQPADAVA